MDNSKWIVRSGSVVKGFDTFADGMTYLHTINDIMTDCTGHSASEFRSVSGKGSVLPTYAILRRGEIVWLLVRSDYSSDMM